MEHTFHKQPSLRAIVWASLVAGVLLVALAGWLVLGKGQPAAPRGIPAPASASSPAFEAATGVRVIRAAVTAGGGMLDLRYQVLDPNKAVIVHDADKPPTIIDEATGKTFNTPWMQHSHSGDLTAGVTYNLMLMNSGGVIKRGSPVTIVIGDARLEHVSAQ